MGESEQLDIDEQMFERCSDFVITTRCRKSPI